MADPANGNLGATAEASGLRGGFTKVGGAGWRFLGRGSNLEALCSGCHGGS